MLERDRQGADKHNVDRYEQRGEAHPNIRSRFVAREIAHDKDTAMFAATPPLEANKLLYSLAVTEGVGYFEGDQEGGMCLMFVDIKRAFFQCQCKAGCLRGSTARRLQGRYVRTLVEKLIWN